MKTSLHFFLKLKVFIFFSKLHNLAYNAFTQWVHGLLGKGKRLEIPICDLAAIQSKFPGETIHGFQMQSEEELTDSD